MIFTAQQISDVLEGTIEGDNQANVSALAKIEEAQEGSLTFLANAKYKPYLYTTKASIVIINQDFEIEKPISTTVIRVKDAYKAFSSLLEYYHQLKPKKVGVEQPSHVNPSAKIGQDVYIGAFSYISENVEIGDNVQIHPNAYLGAKVTVGNNSIIYSGVQIYDECVIGDNCIIHSGTIIGSDGFGFAPDEQGEFKKVPQIGNVIVEDHVEIGATCTIDRATMGSTIIRKGVKLDNQVHIAHNVEVGEHTVIAAQAGVAGSSKIGKHCMIGGQVGISGHLNIGDKVKIQAQSGVGRNLKNDAVVQGSPTLGYTDFNRSYVHFKNLPKIVKELEDIKKIR